MSKDAGLHAYQVKEVNRIATIMQKRGDEQLKSFEKPVEAEAYAREFAQTRDWAKTDSYLVWKKGRTHRGIYASWKDDNFIKFAAKEVFRFRTLPWLLAATFMSTVMYKAFGFGKWEDAKDSINWYPFGYPPGSRVGHLIHDLVEKDMPKVAAQHLAPAQQGLAFPVIQELEAAKLKEKKQ